jgi:hypothetical protein
MSTNPWNNISTPRMFSFFRVLYHNAMTFDSDLKFVGSTALEHLYAAASRTSRLDGERE